MYGRTRTRSRHSYVRDRNRCLIFPEYGLSNITHVSRSSSCQRCPDDCRTEYLIEKALPAICKDDEVTRGTNSGSSGGVVFHAAKAFTTTMMYRRIDLIRIDKTPFLRKDNVVFQAARCQFHVHMRFRDSVIAFDEETKTGRTTGVAMFFAQLLSKLPADNGQNHSLSSPGCQCHISWHLGFQMCTTESHVLCRGAGIIVIFSPMIYRQELHQIHRAGVSLPRSSPNRLKIHLRLNLRDVSTSKPSTRSLRQCDNWSTTSMQRRAFGISYL